MNLVDCDHGHAGYVCSECAEVAYNIAISESIVLGFPILEGTMRQIGYGSVIRLKAWNRLGEGISWIIEHELEAGWWIGNKSALNRGALHKAVGELITKSKMRVADPYKAKRTDLEEAIAKLKADRAREEKILLSGIQHQLQRFDRSIVELEIELGDLIQENES